MYACTAERLYNNALLKILKTFSFITKYVFTDIAHAESVNFYYTRDD